MPQGWTRVAETAASAWKPVAETKAPEQTGMISSFVKGLKNFTPPLGAGSVYNEEETNAALTKARTDPAGFLVDQIPFVSQIKKIASDLKSGKDKGDVAAEAVGELIAGAASSPPILMGGATPTTARARYGGGLAETPKPSKPVNVGGLMDMAKTGKDILQVLKSPNPLTKLSALGRLFEKFASEVTPIEAPPTPTVVEAPPVASGTPVRPPLRGKQFGTFNDPTAPPLPAGVQPSGPVRPPLVEAAPPVAPGVPLRPPLRGRQFGTTVAQMMREEVPGRQFGTSSQSRLVPAEVPAATVPAEVPPAAVETPQPATPAPSAAGKPVTAATLMEEVAKPAGQVNNPNYDWRAPEGITAEFKQYLKDSGFDVVPDRPEFDPTNPKAQGKFGGGAKTQVNMDAKANRFVEYLKANKMEPTPDNVARATETLGEADHPSAHTLEKIYTQMGYDALDVEMLARSLAKAEKPAASAAAKPPAIEKASGDFSNLDTPDDYLYHVTTKDRAAKIMKQGFSPASKQQSMAEGFYRDYSKGKTFFSEKNGVSYWKEKIDQHLANEFDNPAETVVLRVPKSLVGNLEADAIGAKDSGAGSFYTTKPVGVPARTVAPKKPAVKVDAPAAPRRPYETMPPSVNYDTSIEGMAAFLAKAKAKK